MRGDGTGKPKDPMRQFIRSLGLFCLFGMVCLRFVHLPLFAFATCLHALTFALAGMNLAIWSGSFLFNPVEFEVLSHRPISPRALLGAKIRVLVEISFALALALNVADMIARTWLTRSWRFIPAHIISVFGEVILCASGVTLLYNLCLRFFGRQRLDNLMTTTQVLFGIGAVIGSQVVTQGAARVGPRLFEHPPLWLELLPPAWFGALDAVLAGGEVSPRMLALASAAVVITSLCAWASAAALAGAYEQGLGTLTEAVSSSGHKKRRRRPASARLIRIAPFRWWLGDPVERATFALVLAHLGRARDVKLRTYPMVAQLLVMPCILLFTVLQAADAGTLGGGGAAHTFLIAFSGAYISLLPLAVLEQLRMSDSWQASEIFFQAPIERPAAAFHGTRKAVICLLCAPALLLLAGALVFYARSASDLALLLPGAVSVPLVSLIPGLKGPALPFSQPAQAVKGATGCLFSAGLALGAGLVAAIAAYAWRGGWFVWMLSGEILVVAGASYGVRRALDRQQFDFSE